ncbi:hypothetical protein [Desulfosporosinus sp. FKA]|uniref:hypothetical protein n=1 Tax=Desulfosporosinus sp. FKA TaxID=1969834 RepID=UPI000B49E7D5|nr:hypothetical protein [Desulfosporosinus sp. FKA]
MDEKQSRIKDELNYFISTRGVKAKFIADECNIDPSLLCRFRQGKKSLWDETLQSIENFLVSTKGY